MTTFGLATALGHHPLFSALGEAERHALVRSAEEIHLAQGDVLYTSGTPAEQVFIVVRGALQVEFPLAGETRGRVMTLLLAPAFLGECQVVNRQPWSGTGVAVTDLVALGVVRAAFLELLGAHAELTRRLYLELTRRYLMTLETIRHQPMCQPAQAIARYLVALRNAQRAVQAEAAGELLAVRQAEVGRAAGLRRETVNRVLSGWIDEGRIHASKAGIDVRDPGFIEALAKTSAAVPLLQGGEVPPQEASHPTDESLRFFSPEPLLRHFK